MGFKESYTYDSVAAYMIPFMYMRNLQDFLKNVDVTDDMLANLLSDKETYENIRRNLAGLSVMDTIYGPVRFDEKQQNAGRRPGNVISVESDGTWGELKTSAPDDVKEALVPYPSKGGGACAAGYKREDALFKSTCLMCSRCAAFGVEDKTRLSSSSRLLGNILMIVAFTSAALCILWTFIRRTHEVVRFAQPHFLAFIAIGTMISSLSIFAMSAEDKDDDPQSGESASTMCMLQPTLYSIGFSVTFSALFAKTRKVHTLLVNTDLKVVRVTISSMILRFMVPVIVLNGTVLVIWAATDPSNMCGSF